MEARNWWQGGTLEIKNDVQAGEDEGLKQDTDHEGGEEGTSETYQGELVGWGRRRRKQQT